MKLFWPFIAALILLRPLLPVLDYVVNYDYIVDELCVNRDRPELNCNGRCYLMRALAEEASKKRDAEERGAKNNLQLSVTYFMEHGAAWEFACITPEPKTKAVDSYLIALGSGHPSKLLKPPILNRLI